MTNWWCSYFSQKIGFDISWWETCEEWSGEMSMSEDSKQKAWLEHYQKLLNVEFDWDPDHLSYQPPVEGPPIPITIDMVKKAISQMKAGKAPGPSGIVVEMIWAAGDMGASMIRDLAAAIIRDGKVPSDWEQSFIVCLYKGKGDALERGNYRGLKLTEQVMKILERIVDGLIRQLVSIDDSQFGFVPGRGTTDAIFVVRQLQEKYLAANKRLYMAFIDLEKAFDRVPRKVIWWALRKLGVEEWIVRLVQGMYANARSHVRVGEGYSEEFEVKVGVHQGSVLSPMLLIIVLEALSREFHSGVPWEDLYAHGHVIIAECVRRLLTWKEAMEKKGLRINAGKTKIMICGMGLELLQSLGEFPCAICRTGVGSNSIFCNGCKHWVHKKCSGLKHLKKDSDYRCTRCQGTARPLDGRPQKEVQVGPDKLEVVASFCYLGDMLSAAGGCELSTTTHVKTAWKKFKDLLPVLSSRHLSFKTRGRVYSSCVQSAMLHASETWPLTKPNLQRLQRNDRAMIRQICNVRPQDIVTTRSNELLVWLGIEDLDLILKERRLMVWTWNAPVVQSRQPVTYRLMESVGLGGPRWHGNSWQRGIAESGSSQASTLMIDIPGDLVWDLPCVQQASYLEGGPLVWMLPLYLHVNQKSDYDMMIWCKFAPTVKFILFPGKNVSVLED